MGSPTTRSLDLLRKEGYPLVQVVEKWIPKRNIRVDLYSIIDVLAVGRGRTVAVQTTSASNMASRRKKMREMTYTLKDGTKVNVLQELAKAGWVVELHGWRKKKAKRGGKRMVWHCNREFIIGGHRIPRRRRKR